MADGCAGTGSRPTPNRSKSPAWSEGQPYTPCPSQLFKFGRMHAQHAAPVGLAKRAGPGAPAPQGTPDPRAARRTFTATDDRQAFGAFSHIGDPNDKSAFKLRVGAMVPTHPGEAVKRQRTRIEPLDRKPAGAGERDYYVSSEAFDEIKASGLRALTKNGIKPKADQMLVDVAPFPSHVDFSFNLLGIHTKDAAGEDLTWIKVFELLHRLGDKGCACLSANMEYYDCRNLIHPKIHVTGRIGDNLHSTYIKKIDSVDGFVDTCNHGDILVLGPGEHHLRHPINKPVIFVGCPHVNNNGEETLPKLTIHKGTSISIEGTGSESDRAHTFPLAFAGLHVTINASNVTDNVQNTTQVASPLILFYNCKIRTVKMDRVADSIEKPVLVAKKVHIDNCYLLVPEDLIVIVAKESIAITESTICGTVRIEGVHDSIFVHKNNIAAPIILAPSINTNICRSDVSEQCGVLFLHNYIRETVFFPWLVLSANLNFPYVEPHPDQPSDHAISRTYAVVVPAEARSTIVQIFLADATITRQNPVRSPYKSQFNTTVILDQESVVFTESLPEWHMLVVPKPNNVAMGHVSSERVNFNRPQSENTGGGCVIGYVAPGSFKEPPLKSIPTWEIFLESNFTAFHIHYEDLVVINGSRGTPERKANLKVLADLLQWAGTSARRPLRSVEELIKDAMGRVSQLQFASAPVMKY